jgi:cytoskeletal protein CcmA (bactofilin family)
MAETKSKHTLIEDGTELDGVIASQCAIVVSGKVKGQLTAPTLTVNPAGRVDGQLKVGTLVSRGEVAGHIEADSVELSGRVGERTVLRAKTLEVKLDSSRNAHQLTFGDCQLEVAGTLAAEQAQKGAASKSTVPLVVSKPQR